MNATIRQSLARYKRRIEQRLDKHNNQRCDRPALTASNIQYELAERTRAISAGGIGLIHRLVKAVGLDDAINRRVRLFKLNLPYHESDHVLNIAYNVLAGGTCLEHLELLRNNEVYLDALGARRIPDPTTAGDFCRRFSSWDTVLCAARISRGVNPAFRQFLLLDFLTILFKPKSAGVRRPVVGRLRRRAIRLTCRWDCFCFF